MIFPDQKFFKPTPKFWNFLDDTEWLRWPQFIDVGAGMGHLTDAMIESGRECIGFDLHSRPGQSPLVLHRDAILHDYGVDDCVILARPCHGSFVHRILQRSAGHSNVLYIGLERNLDDDLDGWGCELLAENVGEDGEDVYYVLGCKEHMGEWCLLKPSFWPKPAWMQSDDEKGWWRNEMGGGFPKDPSIKILERKRLSSHYQLHFQSSDMCDDDPTQRNGWLDPKGGWYPGPPYAHAAILSGVFGISEARAEAVGFVRCYGTGSNPFWTSNRGRTTPEQRTKLSELGFHIRDDFQETRETE